MFGSRTKGKARKFSDLDLAVNTGSKLPSSIMINIKFDLEESDLPYKVDVIDWNATSEHFREIIADDCIELWGNGAEKG